MAVAPGHPRLPAIEFLHRDKFLAPISFVPRHCASAVKSGDIEHCCPV